MKLIRFAMIFFAVAAATSQAVAAGETSSDGAWTHLDQAAAVQRSAVTGTHWVAPEKFAAFSFTESVTRGVLSGAQPDTILAPRRSGTVISVPRPDGSFERFRVARVDMMEPGLAARYPDIQTFTGVGIDDPSATVRGDITRHGFRGSVRNGSDWYYIDPLYQRNASLHVSYYLKDSGAVDPLICHTTHEDNFAAGQRMVRQLKSSRDAFGTDFRTFRLAIATTGEYTAGVGGTVEDGMAAVVSVVNRLNQLYEIEVGVRMVLVANNDLLIYLDGTTDPYTDGDTTELLDENQATLPGVIGGAGNYDIGHVLNSTGSGRASGSVVCKDASKARGTSAIRGSGPLDNQSVYHLAHEVGHQFGAGHSFNGVAGNCNDGNRSPDNAYEPGSGTTILGYPGTCGTDNIRVGKEAYFHRRSLDTMINFIATDTACAVTVPSGNTPPAINAGTDIYVPVSTPFKLKATGSDTDGDTVFYTWEQFDLGVARALGSPDDGTRPLFRSRFPSINPARYFPLNPAAPDDSEILPTVANRDLNFYVTGRDFRSAGGGTNDDHLVVHVIEAPAAPFRVTVGNVATEIWTGTTKEITWDVAGTDAQPFNIFNVNIMLSIDGGNTYPYLLAEAVPNDGSEIVTLPNVTSDQVRVRVEPTGSGVFDISNADITIGARMQINPINLNFGVVCPGDELTNSFEIYNIGSADLIISNVTIAGSSAYSLIPNNASPQPGVPTVVQPGNHINYTVRLVAPTTIGATTANITVSSNDPTTPNQIVTAVASVGEPDIKTMIPNSGGFGNVCLGSHKDMHITVNNEGLCNLVISGITSNNPIFVVPEVLTFPLAVQAGTSVQIPIRYQPVALGAASGAITIASNDPDQPSKLVNVFANTPGGKISVTPCPIDFGVVCPEDLASMKREVTICNTGLCPLNVSNVAISGSDFTLYGLPTMPATLQPGSCFSFEVQFTPTSVGPKTATLTVTSDDPDNPVVNCTVTGETVASTVGVANHISFQPTVINTIGNCQSDEALLINGIGICNVQISTVTITGVNADSFSLVGLPSSDGPITLSPGEVLGDGNLRVRFSPSHLVNERFHQAQVNVTYIADPFTLTEETAVVPLAGEATQTGFRMLVRAGGVPVDEVLKITLKAKGIGANGKKQKSNAKVKNATLRTITAPEPFTSDLSAQYHIEFGGITNSAPLPTGEVTMKIQYRVGKKKINRTLKFITAETCTFNKNIVVDF